MAQDSERSEIEERIDSLIKIYNATHFDDPSKAVELIKQAHTLAESIGEEELAFNYRISIAVSTGVSGRIREAIAILAPNLRKVPSRHKPIDLFFSLMRFIEFSFLVGVPVRKLEPIFNQAEDLVRDAGKATWRNNILYHRGLIRLEQGRFGEALNLLQEAYALYSDEESDTYEPHYLEYLFECALHTNKLDVAEHCLNKIAKLEYPFGNHMKLLLEAEFARYSVDAELAIARARAALHASDRRDSRIQLIRAFLMAGKPELACDSLLWLIRSYRHSEVFTARYDAYILIIDYHLATIRNLLGMEPLDDEWARDTPNQPKLPAGRQFRAELIRTKALCRFAEKHASKIDEVLDGTRYRREVAIRVSRLAAMERDSEHSEIGNSAKGRE